MANEQHHTTEVTAVCKNKILLYDSKDFLFFDWNVQWIQYDEK